MHAIIVGDSQTNSIRKGYLKLRGKRLDLPNIAITPLGTATKMLRPFFRLVEGRIEFTDAAYTARLQRATRRSYLAEKGEQLSYGLCMGFHTAHVCRSKCWSTHVPWRLAGSFPDRQPLSDGAMLAICESGTEHIRALYLQMKEIGAKLFLIMAPPPQEKAIIRHRVPAEITLEVDRFWRTEMLRHAEAYDIPVIGPPEEAYDERGLLKRCFWNDRIRDDRHANVAYGERMVERIVAHLNGNAT